MLRDFHRFESYSFYFMSNKTKSDHRRLKKKLKPGMLITWGRGILNHEILRIQGDGVWVNVNDDPSHHQYAKNINGNWEYFVPFAFRGESNIKIVKK